ncbi:hypothetical protein [Vibrio phage JSF23]|uniref:Uncharacterized protein n=3 Tax=Icepovirus bengalense TaxID=2846603 RepID=A0A076G6F9_9CAUD|nr:hypothetical protein ViPhICP2p33 [Vibrio phage ICP2]ADX87715.1 hypothetical protein [Vibrio phage ICP2]AII27077.1 hypothetical protein ICP22011A_0033 [Vibrio phage ICP2_2011_A]ASV43730.1 hypothetical protein [Vibrio phage JSF23]ASV43826.1 hypothetical protein [Vibrio phage JSF27]
MCNKVPSRLDAQERLQKAYASVTSRSAVIFPNERKRMGTTPRVKSGSTKTYRTATPPRGFNHLN